MAVHPLEAPLAEATRLEPWLSARLAPPVGSESLATLAAAPQRLAALARRLGATHGSQEAFVGATLLFERLAALSAMMRVYPCHLRARLPLAGPEALYVALAEDGEPSGIALSDHRFACLPDDPAATHPDACIVASAAALEERLRERLVASVEPLVHALARPAKRGLRTQWRGAADMVAIAAWCAGIDGGDERAGIQLAESLCDGREPLVGRAGFRPFDYNGQTYLHRVRNTCCQCYRVPEKGYCSTCPLPKPRERERRWQEHHEAGDREG